MKGSTLAGGKGIRDRVENDFYATPPEAVNAILVELKKIMYPNSAREPACGQGHISKEMEKIFPEPKIISTDIVDRGYGIGGVDFLEYNLSKKIDLIITNPPFNLLQEFIEKGLNDVHDGGYVCMFSRIQILEGERRRKLFEENPPMIIYVHSKRVNPLRNGSEVDEDGKKWSSTMCFCRALWRKGRRGPTTIKRI